MITPEEYFASLMMVILMIAFIVIMRSIHRPRVGAKRFNLEQFNMLHQRPIKCYEYWVELHPDHILYKMEFASKETIDKDDLSLGSEKIMTSYERKTIRSSVTSVELDYVPVSKANKFPESYYVVTVSISGSSTDVKVYFHDSKQKEAKDFFEAVKIWMP